MAKNQMQQILEYMQEGNSITPLEALRKFGCLRLGARIWDIRHKLNIPVISEPFRVSKDKIVAKYSLIVKKAKKKNERT